MDKKFKKTILILFLLLLVLGVILTFVLSKEKEIDKKEEVSLVEEVHTKEETEAWKEEIGVTYDEFSEEETVNGEKAAKLAEKYYIDKYGELRETSFFYAESYKDNIFKVIGMDELDGHDNRFSEIHVNNDTGEVFEVSYTE